MNCKPGDLAIVVNDYEEPRNNGALVKVIRRAADGDYRINADWHCEAVSTLRFGSFTLSIGDKCGYRDSELRPIRDPGDDAKDESLSWLPAPSNQKETA